MTQKLIFVLAIAVVGFLYVAMKHALDEPDAKGPPTYHRIETVIHQRGLTCDAVDNFHFLDRNKGWEYYLAHCRDGGRFIYQQNSGENQVYARSCTEYAQKGVYCPQD